jgi:coproporphyrinogen III oxidase-like Fe-S oxidoreductase
MARQAGFDNFNLDLMHGLPDQSLDDALSDLRQAIELKPTHLSWYQLTLEPNTVFWNQPPELPEDDTLWDIQEAGQALLAEHGYAQYEVSAYAQPGARRGTTSITGVSATSSASAPAPTASSAIRTGASCAPGRPACRRTTSTRPKASRPARKP